MGNTDYKASIIHRANTWTADQTFNDDVKISLGTGGDVDIYSEGTNLIITSSARVLIGDTANTFNDGGLTINQGANDDEIISFKSSDVGHPMTALAEADTYGAITKGHATGGGMRLLGFKATAGANRNALILAGVLGEAADTTKSSSGTAIIAFDASITDGSTSSQVAGADQNLVIFGSSGTQRFIFDVEGSGHADVEWIAFDKYDDLALLDATQNVMTGRITPARFGDNSLYYDKEYLEDTGIIGKDSWHTEDRNGRVQQRQMVNFSKLAMLHHGAILQVGDRMIAIEKENAELRKMLEAGRN
jgi:hypothetical protein